MRLSGHISGLEDHLDTTGLAGAMAGTAVAGLRPVPCYGPAEVAALPVLFDGDVVVVGGGSAGCAATVAAARSGARVLLVESGGFLGGTGARVLDSFYGFYAPGGDGRVVGGVGWEVAATLLARGQAFERPSSYGAGTAVTYEPESLKLVWDELVLGSSAGLLLHSVAIGVVMRADCVEGVIVHTGRGPALVRATVTVDASGDAAVAWWAGAAMEMSVSGRRRQPLTATFRVGGVGEHAATSALHQALRQAAESGGYDLPRLDGSAHRTVLPGVMHTNLTRVSGVDATDPWELTAAEVAGRRQVQEYLRFLCANVAGYEHSYLLSTSTRIGVRETRRLVGSYVLTRDDVVQATRFPDAIARCGAPIEDHDEAGRTRWEYVRGGPGGETYDIPFRCLLPPAVQYLVVAGRCLSATHDAHASVRSMAQCMATGHAAGVAAAQAARSGTPPRLADVATLQSSLREQGALL